MTAQPSQHVDPILDRFREELAACPEVKSVILYGPAAHGEAYDETSLHVLIVLDALELPALEAIAPAVTRWRRKGRPMPRIFSPSLLADAADVFPIELLDLAAHRVVLYGDDPLGKLEVKPHHLRLQCERELREKLLRLEEGYLEVQGRPGPLAHLVRTSYRSFALIFRGCLRLLGESVPRESADVHRQLCLRLDLEPAPFDDAERLGRDPRVPDASALFARYYDAVRRFVDRIDAASFTRENPDG